LSCLPVLFLASSIKHIQKSDLLINHTLLAVGIYIVQSTITPTHMYNKDNLVSFIQGQGDEEKEKARKRERQREVEKKGARRSSRDKN